MPETGIQFSFEAVELLEWAGIIDTAPLKIRLNLARAINAAGHAALMKMARTLSENTGLPFDEVLRELSVEEATPEKLEWSVDSSAVKLLPGADLQTSMMETSSDDDMLVVIVTTADELVCEICRDFQHDDPHTMLEVKNFRHDHSGIPGLLHPNCRCSVRAWSSMKKIQAITGEGKVFPDLTMNKIGSLIADAIRGALVVKL